MGDHRENNVQIWTKVGLVLKIDGIPFCLAADMNSSALNSQLLLYMYLLLSLAFGSIMTSHAQKDDGQQKKETDHFAHEADARQPTCPTVLPHTQI